MAVAKQVLCVIMSGALVACHSSSSISVGESSTSASSSAGAEVPSSASFSGMNGVANVDGHRLVASDGRLQLDGVEHGSIDKNSSCTLLVQNSRVRVLVDGMERKASR